MNLLDILHCRLKKHFSGNCWYGRLSSSALATAVSAFSLQCYDKKRFGAVSDTALRQLSESINDDGGWGDSPESPSNMSTTLLVWNTFSIAERSRFKQTISRAEDYLVSHCGSLNAEDISKSVFGIYGKDRTFAAPILMMCALSGRFPDWQSVPRLPFELAAVPGVFYRFLRLPVVSYALPALIGVGLVIHKHRPSKHFIIKSLRDRMTLLCLKKLSAIQPSNGGFLEASPLTAFVLMSLCASGFRDHPVAAKCADFLERQVRADGSFPIDTNLSLWVTTLTMNACGDELLSGTEKSAVKEFLLNAQYKAVHAYTGAAPGGWGWTDLPGAVPDADDTAGAVLALDVLGKDCPDCKAAAEKGIEWLLNLQNSDGGIPTFCKGWGKLVFDRSSPELTAHAFLAWSVWKGRVSHQLRNRILSAECFALQYLLKSQKANGSWEPLWFGNQNAPCLANPVYGTARVLRSLALSGFAEKLQPYPSKAVVFLLSAQNIDGGWGGAKGVASSAEETGVAVAALKHFSQAENACQRGRKYLETIFGKEDPVAPSPVGLYFSRLWYSEELYPFIFASEAFA